jgi:hypothetical protein
MRALLVVLASCATTPKAIAPRPFTAEQIRDAMPAGAEIRYRWEKDGQPPTVSLWTVTASDAGACTIRSETFAEDGTPAADAKSGTSRWTELMEHATFPADATTRTETAVEVPAGRFDAWLYEVRRAGKVERFYFAKSLPGPPVLLVVEQDGRPVLRMSLLSRK